MPLGMALDVYRQGEARDMARHHIDVHGQGRGPSAQPLRSYSQFIDPLQDFPLKGC